jgi:hypothetical protein
VCRKSAAVVLECCDSQLRVSTTALSASANNCLIQTTYDKRDLSIADPNAEANRKMRLERLLHDSNAAMIHGTLKELDSMPLVFAKT